MQDPPPAASAAGLPRWLITRLAILMFVGYAIMGSWFPVFSLYLKENLGFSPTAIARISATNAIGALIAPLLWGQIADRWIAADRCLGFCAFATMGLLFMLAQTTDPIAVFFLSVAHWFFMIPILTLSVTLTFRHLPHPEIHFGRVRLWGTVGWVAATLLLGIWLAYRPTLADSLYLGAFFALITALYTLTLPATPPITRTQTKSPRWWHVFDAPLQSIRLFKRRNFAIYAISLFGTYITMAFTTQLNPLLLKQLGFTDSQVPFALSLAQSSEIASLAVLPWILSGFQKRWAMLLGIGSWTLGLSLLTWGEPAPLVVASFVTHGIFICCFLVIGQLFVNRQAGHDFRASAQGLLQWISGLGILVGHLVVGMLRNATEDHFTFVYAPAACLALLLTLLLACSFFPDEVTSTT